MPLVRIDMISGRSPEQVRAVAGAVQRSLIDVLKIPERGLADVGVNGKYLFVSYFENGPEDWSFADGRAQYVEGDLAIPGRSG